MPPAEWDTEFFIIQGTDRADLVDRLAWLRQYVLSHRVVLRDLAYSLNTSGEAGAYRIGLVAGSLEELINRLERASKRLSDPKCVRIKDAAGIYFHEQPLYPSGKIGMLFPGEGAQYLGMMGDVAEHFPEVQRCFEMGDRNSKLHSDDDARARLPISRFMRKPQQESATEREKADRELRSLGNAMFSVLVADWAMAQLLDQLRLPVHAVAGHSIGELAAIWHAGCIGESKGWDTTAEVIKELESQEAKQDGNDAMLLAIGTSRIKIETFLRELNDPPVTKSTAESGAAPLADQAFLAMDNCPHQSVVVGLTPAMQRVEAAIREQGWVFEQLPLSRAYHTPLFTPFIGPLAKMFEAVEFFPPQVPLYSCTTAQLFPPNPAAIRELAVKHWYSPVEFTRLVQQMYDDGIRIIVEAGPRGNLSSFVEDILRGKPCEAIAANVPHRSGTTQLNHLAAQLAAHHVPLNWLHFYERREPQPIEWEPQPMPKPPCEPNTLPISTRSERLHVMQDYWSVMDDFLETQQAVMQTYLSRRHRSPQEVPFELDDLEGNLDEGAAVCVTPATAAWPLLGSIIEHTSTHLVVERMLDLREDHFAAEHTVGGRQISRVDPHQHGLPVGPMTFTLEMMAEAASLLVPDKVVVSIQGVRLMRWLAYDAEKPNRIRVTATLLPSTSAAGSTEVKVEVYDLGNADRPPEAKPWTSATGKVLLAACYPEPPEPEPLHNPRAVKVTLAETYSDLFHGEMFQGLTELSAISDTTIEAKLVVLPRDGLFESTAAPNFIADPVLMDVAMHPLSAFHLEAADRSGRTMLPFEMKQIQFFGPRPAVGTPFRSRVRLDSESSRHFTHAVDVIDPQNRLWCRMSGAKYWRFYFPFGEINFHGRKDEYFVSQEWSPVFEDTENPVAPETTCVFLKPPEDLQQPTMQQVISHVSLTPREMQVFRSFQQDAARAAWVFELIAAKDAFRILWFKVYGERLFPADIEMEVAASGIAMGRLRDTTRVFPWPRIAVSQTQGVWAAIASLNAELGISIARRDITHDDAAIRVECASQAVRQMVNEAATTHFQVQAIDSKSGRLTLVDSVTGQTYCVYTEAFPDFVIATCVEPVSVQQASSSHA